MDMIDAYQALKSTLDKLHNEILKYITLEQFQEAAVKLRIYENKRIKYANKAEEDYFYDFNIYEDISEKRVIERFSEDYTPKSIIERTLINSMVNSFTSIFMVKEISSEKYQLMLEDLINKKKVYPLTDITLSKTIPVNRIIFTRIIKAFDFYLSTPLVMVFAKNNKKALLEAWQKPSLLDSADTNSFINIFHLHREKGLLLTNTLNK